VHHCIAWRYKEAVLGDVDLSIPSRGTRTREMGLVGFNECDQSHRYPRTRNVVAAQELCPFRIVDGSHGLHNVTRVRTADNNKDLEIAQWKCYGGVCSNNDRSFLVSKYFPAMEQGKPVFFDVAVSE
jgi:hypothetical protein